jgi:DNA-binding FrmR family transcriptional regulator
MAFIRNKISLSKKDKTTSQLKRIRGQVNGLIRMYEDERPCIEIAQQITAARNSLSRVARDVLSNAADQCIRDKDQKQLNLILKELLR